MFVATFLTLYLVPVVYVLFETIRGRLGVRRASQETLTEGSA
jgi:hypothetical protein